MADEKQRLRKILKETRAGLSESRARALSDCVQQRVLALECFHNAPAVALYAAQNGEVRTDRLFNAALAAAKTVYFPRVDSSLNRLSLVAVTDVAALKPGAFGLLEPEGRELTELDKLSDGLICVPGVAFATGGQRLGRGAGFYDRLLAELSSNVVSIGLAYSFQLVDHLPEGPGDRRTDLVATEFSVHRCRSADPRRR
jgi:5-formyltetrahydrofolate cyclo-ligase